MKSIKLPLLVISFVILTASAYSQNSLNPDLNIRDVTVKELNGAYSVISINDNGEPEQFNIKFKDGKIISVVIDGEVIDQEEWKNNEELIKEYLDYLSPEKQKTYKYQEVYELENELKNELKKLEKSVEELEIKRRLDKFYDQELKEWIIELESNLNESEILKEVEDVLEEVMNELDRFLLERKEFKKEK